MTVLININNGFVRNLLDFSFVRENIKKHSAFKSYGNTSSTAQLLSIQHYKGGSPYCYMRLLQTDLMYMWSEFQVENLEDSCVHVRLWRNVNQCNWLFYDLRECRVLQVDQMSALWAWITPQELHSNCFILGLLKPNKLGKASHLQQETPAFLHLKVSEPFVVVTSFLLSTSWISLCLVSFERFGQWRSQCFALKACNIRIQHHWVVYLIHSVYQ